MQNAQKKIYFPFLLMSLLFFSCRGQKSESPPIMPIQNMVEQSSYGPQSENLFFKDKRATRSQVEGTVASGEAHNDTRLYVGVEPNSPPKNPVWVKTFPITLSAQNLKKGQENYNIYCSPCHGYDAQNDGLVTKRAGGCIRPANLLDQEKINLPVGKIYDAVTNGVNNWNMPGFLEQMNVQDRWAVVAYVRALQLSKRAVTKNKPSSMQKEQQGEKPK